MFPQRQFENSESVHKRSQFEITDRYYCTIEGDLVGRIGMVTLPTRNLNNFINGMIYLGQKITVFTVYKKRGKSR